MNLLDECKSLGPVVAHPKDSAHFGRSLNNTLNHDTQIINSIMKTFLPNGYEAPAGTSDYMKFSDGDNRFRVLSDEASIGWEGWKDGKPFRRKGIEQNITEDEVDTDAKFGKPKPKINHFWAFLVYDYADKCVKILTVTQKTIMKAIEALATDEDWGNPTAYDLNVKREEKGGRVSYTVTSYPPKPLAKEVQLAAAAAEINLDDLFEQELEKEFKPTKRK